MILYHAVNTYQLLSFIIYHKTHKSDEKAVLLVTTTLMDKYPQIEKLKGNVFNSVWKCPIIIKTGKHPEESIVGYFDQFFSKHHVAIKDFSRIYLGCAHYFFGIYLSIKKTPYIFYEDANGLLSRPEILRSINEDAGDRYDLAEKYGLFDGTGEYVQKCMCDMSSQVEGYTNETAIDFRVVDSYRHLPEADRDWIIDFFCKTKEIDILEDAVLLLTQHFANLDVMTFQEQVLIYQIVMDYFFQDENVVFKMHPNDLLYYSLLFPKAQVINERFPSEFLPILLNKPIKTLATISSTAIGALRRSYPDVFELSARFEREFKGIHRLYTALKAAAAMHLERIGLIGINELAVKNLIQRADPGFSAMSIVEPEQAELVLVDNLVDDEDTTDDSICCRTQFVAFMDANHASHAFVFINSKNDYVFHDPAHKEMWDHMQPIRILKTRTRQADFYASTAPETIFLYTENERWHAAVEKQEMNKELEYTGMNIRKIPITDEQRRLLILEGVLEATEKRLLYYIKREKELMELLEKKHG